MTRAQTVVLCLRDSEAVWAVTSGSSGIFAGEIAGRTIIDLSTNHVELATVLHGLAAKARGSYLEAPVLGSVVPAAAGELTVLVSGEEAAFEAARPLLEIIGSRLFFLGAPGLATKMKLACNLVLATTLAGLADATAIAEASGIAREQALEILGAGPGNGVVLASKRDKVLQRGLLAPLLRGPALQGPALPAGPGAHAAPPALHGGGGQGALRARRSRTGSRIRTSR